MTPGTLLLVAAAGLAWGIAGAWRFPRASLAATVGGAVAALGAAQSNGYRLPGRRGKSFSRWAERI